MIYGSIIVLIIMLVISVRVNVSLYKKTATLTLKLKELKHGLQIRRETEEEVSDMSDTDVINDLASNGELRDD